MKRLLVFVITVSLAWTTAATPVQRKTGREQTKQLQPSKDATLIENAEGLGGSSKGASFFVGRTGQPEESIQKRRALIAFDLTTIPRRSRIMSVTLTMKVLISAGEKPSTINLYRVTQSWNEGTSIGDSGRGAKAEDGDPTWIHSAYPNTRWSQPGGDYVEMSSAKTDVDGAGRSYTWESTPTLVADVQSWVDSPKTNFGWILIGDESEAQTAKRFYSREAKETDRPQLTVVFRPPSR
jgi:hypothetical protein